MELADANIILRYLRNDDPKLSPLSKLFFEKAIKGQYQIYFDEVAVAEVVWVLTSVYKTDREKIWTFLAKLIPQEWIFCPKKELVLKALNYYHQTNFSYIDCWLYVVSLDRKISLKTFDKKLEKFSRAT